MGHGKNGYEINYIAGVQMRVCRVLWMSTMLRQWSFAVLLLSIPLPVQGQPIHALSNRMKRTVSQAQLMHDRGRYLQDRKRRLWLQELFEQVHTANVWDAPSSSEANVQHVTWSNQFPKAASSTKDYLLEFQLESRATINILPQETNKEQPAATKKKKRVCLGKWRENNKQRGWPCSMQAQLALRGH